MKGGAVMATKEARARAVAKYEKNNYDKVLLRLPKGKKEEIQATGQSLNGFITKAIDEKLNREKAGE